MRSLTQSSANSFICNPITVPLPLALQMTDTTPGLHPSERHLVVPFPETTHKANPFFNIDNNPYLLSMRTRHHVNQAIQKSLADSTFKQYTGSINQFIRFCDKERVPVFPQMSLYFVPLQLLAVANMREVPLEVEFRHSKHGTWPTTSNGRVALVYVTS